MEDLLVLHNQEVQRWRWFQALPVQKFKTIICLVMQSHSVPHPLSPYLPAPPSFSLAASVHKLASFFLTSDKVSLSANNVNNFKLIFYSFQVCDSPPWLHPPLPPPSLLSPPSLSLSLIPDLDHRSTCRFIIAFRALSKCWCSGKLTTLGSYVSV